MGCCDGSTIEFRNKSDTTWTVTGQSSPNEISNIPENASLDPNSTLVGSASSSDGWNGFVWGGVQFTNSDGNQMILDFFFIPANRFGFCPCNAAVALDDIIVGQYKATASRTEGNNDGQAKVTWTIENDSDSN